MRTTSLFVALLLTPLLGGCAVKVRPVTLVEIEPPRENPDGEPGARRGALWVQGRWEYRGSRWSWRAGEWVKPRRGYVWHDGNWERHAGRWHWVEGHWRTERSDTTASATLRP